MIAKEPDIIAWLAIIAAETAVMKVGQNIGPAIEMRLCLIQTNLEIELQHHITLNNYLELIYRKYQELVLGVYEGTLLDQYKLMTLTGTK